MNTKIEWRRILLQRRRAMDASVRAAASHAIVEQILALQQYADCAAVLTYEAIGAEVDPRALSEHARRGGKAVFHPIAGVGMTANRWDYWVRVETQGAPTSDVDSAASRFVVVPGVGFDLSGARLGRGAGFYDRALRVLRAAGDAFVVGIAFDAQVAEQLPVDQWDQAVDAVVTERRVIVPGLKRTATSQWLGRSLPSDVGCPSSGCPH